VHIVTICYAVHVMQAGVLLGLQQPMLFVNGEADGQCPTGLLAQLLLSDQASCKDARLVVLPVSGWPVTTSTTLHKLRRLAALAVETAHGRPPTLPSPSSVHQGLPPCVQRVDLHSATGEGRSLPAPVLQQVTAAVSQFVDAVTHGTLEACPLPRLTQQQAAAAPPGSLPSRQTAQPSWQQKPSSLPEAAFPMPGNGRGAADGAAPALQPWQQPPQPNSRAHPAPMLQVETALQAAATAPHRAAQATHQLQGLQAVESPGDGIRKAMWQPEHAADPNAAAPMQLDAPAAQHSRHPEQHVVPADAMKQSSSPDGMAADAATGATAPSDTISSDYDSDEGQQQVQQEWRPQHSQQLPSPLSQPKQEQPAQHAGMDANALLQQGHSGHAMPAMQQMAAAALWQQQQPHVQVPAFGHQHGAMLMPKAEQPNSQHHRPMPGWQHEAAMPFHNQEAAGRPNLQEPEAMQQQQMGQPAVVSSIGQLPLNQIWGQGALSSNVLASLMAGHQQSATSPNLRGP
jgi:hypothetical protein